MKHNTDIPGWNSHAILDVLGKYASEVEDGGVILELGALFGRSTYTLGHNKKDSVKLISIDMWPTILMENHRIVNFHDDKCSPLTLATLNSKIIDGKLDGIAFYNLWKEFTKDIVNHVGFRNFTTMPNKNFPDVDIIYHDADHTYERVYKDLIHWLPKLKPNGIIIVDDYEITHFPEVIRAVDQFADENNFGIENITERNVLLRRKA